MLVSKKAQVRWNGSTRKHYEAFGYVWGGQNNWFEVPIEHLIKTTPVKVEVECDYCGTNHLKEYRAYFKSREIVPKDCCGKRKCMVQKSEESSLITYGVKNINQTEERKEYARKLYQTPKEEVLKVADSKGITILNIEEYQNDRTRLLIICEKHKQEGNQETNYANIKKNKNCCIHINKEIVKGVPRLDGNQVYQEFIDQGLIPLFEAVDYINNSTPLPYHCPNHLEKGIQFRAKANLLSCIGCGFCANERAANTLRKDINVVIELFESKGLIIVDTTDYKNKEAHVRFECVNHRGYVQSVTASGLEKTKIPCVMCREDQSLAILSRKVRSSIGQWVKNAQRECDYKCILTGSEQYDVHHTYTLTSIIKDSLLLLGIPQKEKYESHEVVEIRKKVRELHKNHRGVCIHPVLHNEFHILYKKKNNTLEQFEEFQQRFNNGEFNHLVIS